MFTTQTRHYRTVEKRARAGGVYMRWSYPVSIAFNKELVFVKPDGRFRCDYRGITTRELHLFIQFVLDLREPLEIIPWSIWVD